MNWKKWVGLFGLVAGILFLGSSAQADTYQLAASSFTVTKITVSSTAWTQVDVPALAGRTSITVYNVDVTSTIYCQGDVNAFIPPIGVWVTSNTASLAAIPISPLGTSSPNPPSWLNLSLSNFASNRGAYPVSVAMPVYCVTGKSNATGLVEVLQSF